MSHIYICLVSEQTVPNILGIFHNDPEKVIFCSTKKMEQEKRTDAIINTLRLYGKDYGLRSDRIVVDQDCLEDCEAQIMQEVVRKYQGNQFVINLTGGTKIMVLAAYNVFQQIEGVRMIYTPIPKNEFLEIYPRTDKCSSPVSYLLRLTVEGYVTAYGVGVKNHHKVEKLKANARKNRELCNWMVEHYRDIEDILGELYGRLKDQRDNRTFRLKLDYQPKKGSEREFLKKLGLHEGRGKAFTKEEIRFLTGDWLSDYCFNEISSLPIDDCVTGIELVSPKGADNEFDVMFTKDNALYLLECKSLKQKHDKDADILYKISALQHDFGLRVTGFLVSTARTIISDRGIIKESIERRAKQCGSCVIHPDDINNLAGWLRNHVKGLS